MARPAGADSEVTRARLQQAAARLFAERGVGGTSVRAIADECGVTSATVHHYFGGKDDLHRAVVDAMYLELDGLRGELAEALAHALPTGGLAAIVEEAVRRLFRFAVEHDATVRMLLRNAIESGELDPERRREVHLPFLADVAGVLPASAGPTGRLGARLAIQSVMHLIVRYALTSPHELGLVCGLDSDSGADDVREVRTVVEDHLVAAALTLMSLENPPC